ncbi:MAG: hypothetical protein V4532_04490 [Pseudomonadota bacterium]
MKSSTSVSLSSSTEPQFPLLNDQPDLTQMWSSFGEVGVQFFHATADLSKVWIEAILDLQSSMMRMFGEQVQVLAPPDMERAAWPGAGD